MVNLKGMMKEPTLDAKPGGLLKKKPFGKPSKSTEVVPSLMKRLTGK